MAAIGVHFGYTCACVAVFKDGRADVVANDAGDRVTPAVVAYRDTEQVSDGEHLSYSQSLSNALHLYQQPVCETENYLIDFILLNVNTLIIFVSCYD